MLTKDQRKTYLLPLAITILLVFLKRHVAKSSRRLRVNKIYWNLWRFGKERQLTQFLILVVSMCLLDWALSKNWKTLLDSLSTKGLARQSFFFL